jgi:hypothetical protein
MHVGFSQRDEIEAERIGVSLDQSERRLRARRWMVARAPSGPAGEPRDDHGIGLDDDVDILPLHARERGHDPLLLVRLEYVDRRLPSRGRARVEELTMQPLRPFDLGAGVRPHPTP